MQKFFWLLGIVVISFLAFHLYSGEITTEPAPEASVVAPNIDTVQVEEPNEPAR